MPEERVQKRLDADETEIAACRALAHDICAPIVQMAEAHTTTSIERACLRLVGVEENATIETFDQPLVNRVVDAVQSECGLENGVLGPLFEVLVRGEFPNVSAAAEAIAFGQVVAARPRAEHWQRVTDVAHRTTELALSQLTERRRGRLCLRESQGDPEFPWLYVIVATGDIREDARQARAAALRGVHAIAVIRSTAQSLLEFVPNGETREGYGGTYATQENFRIMRAALDAAGQEAGHYVRLTNFASGLCMPEMAAIAAIEGLDIMLNDAMYGILFRNINMQRTLIDQHFSRQVHAASGIMINTGEDSYLKVVDAVEFAHTVLASNFINEQLALSSGLPHHLIGLGRAMEIAPDIEGQLSLEIAHAQLARECFPEAVMKWMPPTRHLDGNIFMSYVYNALYNLVGAMTGQDILLLGMLTEGVCNPFVADRDLAIANAKYVHKAGAGLSRELVPTRDARIKARARKVLADCRQMLAEVEDVGLFRAIEAGMFAQVSRAPKGGRGLEGVIKKGDAYFNPVRDHLVASSPGGLA